MANVFLLLSTGFLAQMLGRVGFSNIKVADITVTTTEEQRATPWMTFQIAYRLS